VALIVNSAICEALEKGVVPWKKPWKGRALPMNMISRKPYRGINLLLLSLSPFTSPYYLTYKQVEELGGYVVAGSKGFRIVYWRILEHVSPEGELTTIPLLKYYVCFSVEQVSGIPEGKIPQVEKNKVPPIARCESILRRMPKRPLINGARDAYYDMSRDVVGIPPRGQFVNAEEYYSTLFHELGHSTAHPSRLNREVKDPQLSMKENYSKEELVAELCNSYLSHISGISPRTIGNHASYAASWLRVFDNDRWFLLSASASAQKAANFILGAKDENIAGASTWEGDYHASY
jgi:antirestriction protein ArdC